MYKELSEQLVNLIYLLNISWRMFKDDGGLLSGLTYSHGGIRGLSRSLVTKSVCTLGGLVLFYGFEALLDKGLSRHVSRYAVDLLPVHNDQAVREPLYFMLLGEVVE